MARKQKTCGHLPRWLNISHTKLNTVKHADYMPKEYLPMICINDSISETNFNQKKKQ
ncbi:MAG: hypothetical protein PHE26_10805 [Syntrophomonadaceae bacterium]|nr:hypothetical protein [Syntrophomonadaceae bacterium]